jgi:hypothetical protein
MATFSVGDLVGIAEPWPYPDQWSDPNFLGRTPFVVVAVENLSAPSQVFPFTGPDQVVKIAPQLVGPPVANPNPAVVPLSVPDGLLRNIIPPA